MYYQTGSMRQFNNDLSPGKNSNVWQRENEFQYAQRSKYEKSEVSYGQQPKSKVIYEEQKTDRFQKASENNKQFAKVPITIKSSDREDYLGTFRIQLQKTSQKSCNTIAMYLTNDSDSLFLWNFCIRDQEFLPFKNHQRIKGDFHEFPDLINQYVGICMNSNLGILPDKGVSYYAVFEIAKGNEQAEMKIMEVNKYKQSCHLNLKFKKANDQQTKIFLSNKYDKEKKQKSKLNDQLSQAVHKLNLRMQQLEKLHLEYQQLQKQSNGKIYELERRQKQKIKELTLKIQQQHMKKQKNDAQANKKRNDQLNSKIEQLKTKYEEVYSNYQKANQRIINLQASQNSLKSRNSILEQQSQSFQKQNKQLKAKQLKLNQDYHSLRNQNTKLSCTIQSLEDRLKQKDQRITQNIQVKSTNFNQISTLQESLRQQKKKVEKLQQKNDCLEAEINKLIKKNQDLSGKLHKKKENIGDYKQILTMQQDKIENYQKQFKKMQELIAELKRDREKVDLQLKDRQIKIKDLKSHIQQNQQHIESQKKIMSELNRKLNQKGVATKSFVLPSTLPTYNGIGSGLGGTGLGTTSIVGRQYSSTISSTSQSRLKYSPSPVSITSPLNEKITERVVPPFKKYRDGIENDRDQQNYHHSQSHSRSPIGARLNQQLDPEEADKTKEKIGPIKFKK